MRADGFNETTRERFGVVAPAVAKGGLDKVDRASDALTLRPAVLLAALRDVTERREPATLSPVVDSGGRVAVEVVREDVLTPRAETRRAANPGVGSDVGGLAGVAGDARSCCAIAHRNYRKFKCTDEVRSRDKLVTHVTLSYTVTWSPGVKSC